MTGFATGGGDYRMAGRAPFPAPQCNRPGNAGPVLKRRSKAYWRIQVCDLQMKAMQPDTSSFLPPSISSIFDL